MVLVEYASSTMFGESYYSSAGWGFSIFALEKKRNTLERNR